MRQAFMLLGIMTLIVTIGAFIAFERAEAPTIQEITSTNITTSMALSLTSPVFEDGEHIPSVYTCDGENVNPELHINNVPEGTRSLVLIMDDPDIPESVKERMGIEKYNHWAVFNIMPDTAVIPENSSLGIAGLNSSGEAAYTGPCPPDHEHRYFFRLYALPRELSYDSEPTLDAIERDAKAIALDSAVLIGRYDRSR